MRIFFATTILTLTSFFSTAQINNSDSAVSTYLHINALKGEYGQKQSIISFELTNIDSLGNSNWKSQEITEFEKDKNGYFVKANIPLHVSNNSSEIWCTAKLLKPRKSGYDTIRQEYGGVQLSAIKLSLKSNPEGAETFLVPNRIWQSKIKKEFLNNDDSQLQKYRVNTSSTNTYAYVDETVFVVIFKMDDKYKTIIHNTKPYFIEQEQTVWVDF